MSFYQEVVLRYFLEEDTHMQGRCVSMCSFCMHLVQQMVWFVCCAWALVDEYFGSVRVAASGCFKLMY